MVVGKVSPVVTSAQPRKRFTITDPNEMPSPLRRRGHAVSSPRVDNDDVAERSKRRSEAELQRRVSSIGVTRNGQTADNSALKGQNLQDHFDTCLRMFTQNKINTKNAWNLHIIDYMRSVLHSNAELRDMLQVAGTSLDIGAKVYGLRVDDIHSEALKLANALVRVNLNQDMNARDVDSEVDENVEMVEQEYNENQAKKKKKRLMNGERRLTVCDKEKEENLNAIIPKHHSLFNQFSGPTDSSSLLTVTLPKVPGLSYELLVRSRSRNYVWYTQNIFGELSDTVRAPSLHEPLPLESICPPFTDFSIDLWDLEHENDFAYHSRVRGEVAYDENGIPIPEMGADIPECEPIDDFPMDDDNVSEVGGIAHRAPGEVAYVTDMRPGNEGPLGSLEYSYRPIPNVSDRFNISGVWAGPSHWKIKCLRQSIKANGGVLAASLAGKPKQKRIKLIAQAKNMEEVTMENLNIIRNNKRITRLTAISNIECFNLPEDMRINIEDSLRLGLKPRVRITQSSRPCGLDNLNISNYQYDNPNDNEYCSQPNLIDAWDRDEPPGTTNDDHLADTSGDSFNDEDLITAPDLVQKTFVPYAQKAKIMDMKRLKNAIWDGLVDKSNTDESDVNKIEKVIPTTLSKIYKELPGKISEIMLENLSCPLAFVALLHLANEHSLHLKGTDNLSDVLISKD